MPATRGETLDADTGVAGRVARGRRGGGGSGAVGGGVFAERAIRDYLAKVRPGDGIVGEEYGGDAPNGARGSPRPQRRWIVDPLDGTRSFVAGEPEFGSLIALEEDGEVIVGVASAPALPGP